MISVVIPTAGRDADLRRCLARLAPGAQTLAAEAYDVVVTDDGTPPGVAALASEFPWVRVTQGPRRGPAANRNAGARAATGEWVAFVDDDCIPSRGWLGALAAATATTPAPAIVEGRTTCEAGVRSPLEHAPVNETGGLLWSCNLMVRRRTFLDAGGFDERFPHPHLEDVEFRERARARGLVARFAPDAVVDHPPRRLAPGARLAEMHYGAVLFARLRGERLSVGQLLWRVSRTRWRAIGRHPGVDTLAALASWGSECAHIVQRWGAWQALAAAAAP